VNGYTKADLPNLEADEVSPLYGFLPFPDEHIRDTYPALATHEDKEQRMLELSHKLADAIAQC
jgi:hypothetical protein